MYVLYKKFFNYLKKHFAYSEKTIYNMNGYRMDVI